MKRAAVHKGQAFVTTHRISSAAESRPLSNAISNFSPRSTGMFHIQLTRALIQAHRRSLPYTYAVRSRVYTPLKAVTSTRPTSRMAHSYTFSTPSSTPVDPGIVSFLEKFYEVSDTPSSHEEYADSFADDATFMIGVKQVKDKEDIYTMRKGMWEAVTSRKHTVYKVFPYGEKADELMLYGRVQYGFKDGREVGVDWGARAEMVKDGGKWKFQYYQVYLVSDTYREGRFNLGLEKSSADALATGLCCYERLSVER